MTQKTEKKKRYEEMDEHQRKLYDALRKHGGKRTIGQLCAVISGPTAFVRHLLQDMPVVVDVFSNVTLIEED